MSLNSRLMFIFMGALLGIAIGTPLGAILHHKSVFDKSNAVNEIAIKQHYQKPETNKSELF